MASDKDFLDYESTFAARPFDWARLYWRILRAIALANAAIIIVIALLFFIRVIFVVGLFPGGK